MTVALDGTVVRLTGECRVEDAEPLLAMLQEQAGRNVDLSEARRLHTAVLQILMAIRPEIRGGSLDAFLRTWIEPLLTQVQPGSAGAMLGKRLE
jgi:hypothetical protein